MGKNKDMPFSDRVFKNIFSGKTNAFTLVEVLFSAGVIALALVSILVIFVQTADMSKRVDYEYTATNLAKKRLEFARQVLGTQGYSFLFDLNEDDTEINSAGDGIAAGEEGDFKRTTDVATYLADARMTSVEVTVVYRYRDEWKEGAAVVMSAVFRDPRVAR